MNFDILFYLLFSMAPFVLSQVPQIVHPAALDGPQNEVVPSLFYPKNRVNRFRSRVFRDASQGYRNLVDSPRLFRASGRFHKRVQSATTHDIQNVPLPQDSVQIVSYKYDAEKHNEKKMSENDVITFAEAEDHARGIERTTMAIKTRKDETTTSIPTTTRMPEQNSINELKENNNQAKTFFQTVTVTGSNSNNGNILPALAPQPPVVFTPPPPISPPTFALSNILPPPQQTGIQQQNLPSQPPSPSGFPQRPPPVGGINQIAIPHQPSNPLGTFQPPPATGPSPTPTINPIGQVTPANQAPIGLIPPESSAILRPQSALSATHADNLEGNQSNNSLEQLGCGWDWISNSCKDLFNINWCGKCHDFGNIFLHDCKCVAPLIPLPTTTHPTPPPPPPPAPQRQPLLFWLI